MLRALPLASWWTHRPALGGLALRTLPLTFSREVPLAEGLGTPIPVLHSFMGYALVSQVQ